MVPLRLWRRFGPSPQCGERRSRRAAPNLKPAAGGMYPGSIMILDWLGGGWRAAASHCHGGPEGGGRRASGESDRGVAASVRPSFARATCERRDNSSTSQPGLSRPQERRRDTTQGAMISPDISPRIQRIFHPWALTQPAPRTPPGGCASSRGCERTGSAELWCGQRRGVERARSLQRARGCGLSFDSRPSESRSDSEWTLGVSVLPLLPVSPSPCPALMRPAPTATPKPCRACPLTRSLGVSESRSLGVSESRRLGVSESRNLGISESRSLGVSESRSLGVSGCGLSWE